MLIEVAYCERCGDDSPWRWQRPGVPRCPQCGSVLVSRCERQETKQEIERIIQALQERKG